MRGQVHKLQADFAQAQREIEAKDKQIVSLLRRANGGSEVRKQTGGRGVARITRPFLSRWRALGQASARFLPLSIQVSVVTRGTCARHTGGKAASGAASSRAEIVCRSGSARASPWHTHELGRSVCMCGTLLWPTELDPEHACVQTEVW